MALIRQAVGVVLLLYSWPAAPAGDEFLDAVVQYRVEALDPSGETKITSAVAVQVSPQRLLLTTASPFLHARTANRVKISISSGEEASRYIRPLELVFVDVPANVAILRAPGDRGSPVTSLDLPGRAFNTQPGTSYRTVRFAMGTGGISRPQAVDLALVSPKRFNSTEHALIGIGSPVVAADGALVGLVSSREPDGTVAVLPVSADSLPPSAATVVTGFPSAADATGVSPTKMSFQFSELQDTHVAGATHREYRKDFPAPVGRKIVDASISIGSANNVKSGPSVQISNDGKMATVRYSIESGPLWDRWRGWLQGDVHLTLVPDR